LEFSISYTTPSRGSEQDGREYRFIGREEFEEMVRREEFLDTPRFLAISLLAVPGRRRITSSVHFSLWLRLRSAIPIVRWRQTKNTHRVRHFLFEPPRIPGHNIQQQVMTVLHARPEAEWYSAKNLAYSKIPSRPDHFFKLFSAQ